MLTYFIPLAITGFGILPFDETALAESSFILVLSAR
jgi:hypothetical protein